MEMKKSIWMDLMEGIKQISQATVGGISYIYEKGDEHKHYLIPALNGTIGDKLEEQNSKRAIQMSFRKNNSDISIDELYLEDDLGRSNGELVIFVHGLMADEVLWIEPSRGNKGYGVLLQEEKCKTVLYVRYNTGRHISQNGRSLSNLIERLYLKYGDKIKSTTIIAHSMGGLVTRSSCYYGNIQNQKWISTVKKIYLIGVPNDGAFLEKLGHLTTFILRKIWNFQTKLIANIADERSNGIKDLRWGFMVDEDWQSPNSNDLIGVTRVNLPPLEGVKYYIIVGTLTENENNVVSQYFGDGLVGKKSASGEIFSTADSLQKDFLVFRIFSKINHISLLTSSTIYEYIGETI
jgi:hypothetical protein